jgi:hypothetical protein
VKQQTMFVTPDGQWVLPDSPEFFAALGDPNPDYDASGFAVKNLGFIKFQIIQQSIVEIELHPRNVGFAGLLSVQQQLQSSDVRLFRIKYLEESWQSEISSSAESTIARLSELCTPTYSPAPAERFIVEPKDFSALFHDEDNNLRPIAQKWRIRFGQFDPTVLSLAINHDLLGRMMIVGVTPSRSEPVFRFIGDGHRWIGGRHRLNAMGEKIVNQPDKEYGEWVTNFYRSVALSGQPRYDLVTANLQYEDEPGKPRRSVHYERLMLPWRTPSEEVFVTMCSKILGTADAPAAGIPAGRPPEDDRSVSMKFARSA